MSNLCPSFVHLSTQLVLTECLLYTGTFKSHTGKKWLSHIPFISRLHLSGCTTQSSIPRYSLRQSLHPIILHVCLSPGVISSAGNSFYTALGSQGNGRSIRAWPPPTVLCITCNSTCDSGRCSKSQCRLGLHGSSTRLCLASWINLPPSASAHQLADPQGRKGSRRD